MNLYLVNWKRESGNIPTNSRNKEVENIQKIFITFLNKMKVELELMDRKYSKWIATFYLSKKDKE